MADLKISEMTYKQATADDQFPTVNSSEPGVNNYGLVGDIPLLVGISPWDSNTAYAVGHVVIYSSSITKGLFLVTSTTSPGDSPDGVNYGKFKCISLGFIANLFSLDSSVGYARTGKLSITEPISTGVYLHYIDTNFSETDIENAKITATIAFDGQFGVAQVRSATSSGSGQIAIYIEHFGSLSSRTYYVMYQIEF